MFTTAKQFVSHFLAEFKSIMWKWVGTLSSYSFTSAKGALKLPIIIITIGTLCHLGYYATLNVKHCVRVNCTWVPLFSIQLGVIVNIC